MAIHKTKKKEILDKVTDIAQKSKSVVFVNFHGLAVEDSTKIRRQLRGAGVGYTVAKKTLAKKAFTARGLKGEIPELGGELALAYGEDLIAPAREVFEFQKKLEGKFSILGGVFEDKFMTKDEMTVIASIPSRQTLYGMLVNLINSPIQRVVIALDQVAKTKTS